MTARAVNTRPVRRLMAAAAVAAMCGAHAAEAGRIDGHVYVDENRDGVFSAGDTPVSGALVAWETSVFATTDAQGNYALTAPEADGVVWVRTPEGFSPAPSYAAAPAVVEQTLDLALIRATATGPVVFVATSDSHVGRSEFAQDDPDESLDGMDLDYSLRQATDFEPAPHFFVITGDMAQSGHVEQFAMIKEIGQSQPIPFVPVPGNHDWADNGRAYREWFGPPMYSFDTGGAHFVVLSDNETESTWAAFLRADLARATPGRMIVAFIHRPPEDSGLQILDAAGVDYLFTGHWHSNEAFRFGDLREFSTEAIIRGGMDTTPAGYRIVRMIGEALDLAHRSVVDFPHVEIAYPRIDDCLRGATVDVIAAVQISAREPTVTATLGGTSTELIASGGWTYTGQLPVPSGEAPVLTIAASLPGQTDVETSLELTRCDYAKPSAVGNWPQLQGGPEHRGVSATEIAAPLTTLWARSVGGHIHGGSPIVANGRVYATATQFNDAGGAVVAFDALTGTELWRFAPGPDVRSSPAVADGILVVPAMDGVVHAVDAETGQPLWSYNVGADLETNTTALKAPPTVADGIVYIGVHQRVAALDLLSGVELWSDNPAPGRTTLTSYAAVGVGNGVVFGGFGRGRGGMHAWDALTGVRDWQIDAPDSHGIHAAPVFGDELAYFGNALGDVFAVDAQAGTPVWKHSLFEGGTDWDYALVGTPALYDGLLLVPTQYDFFVALDAATGAEAWRISGDFGPLHSAHARASTRSFSAAPVVAGNYLWIGGADGVLRALEPATGTQLWSADLGSPITSGLAPAGEVLYVGSFDGTLRALHFFDGPLPDPVPPQGATDTDAAGCDCRAGAPAARAPRFGGVALMALALLALVWLRVRARRAALQS